MSKHFLLRLSFTCLLAANLSANEGMWTLDNLPLTQLKEQFDFTPSKEWLKKVQLSSVRLNDGGSGAFVSARGLLITNHHVALGQLQKLSTDEHDYVSKGFFARTESDEVACPDLELNVLISIEDVSSRVQDAINKKASADEKNSQRKAAISRIEEESFKKTGLRSDVIELYQGGQYHLYRYKKYKDVRLVAAPEFQAAFFGGDFDNFTYPRYALDFAFFRAYENGVAAQTPNFFSWSKNGADAGELVFVVGNPGSTRRGRIATQLEFERDNLLPVAIELLNKRRDSYLMYAAAGPEQERRAKKAIFSLANSLKAMGGMLKSLKESDIIKQQLAAESMLLKAVEEQDEHKQALKNAYKRIARIQKEKKSRLKEKYYVAIGDSRLYELAKGIVLYALETQKANQLRFEEYRDSALDSMKFRLLSPAPIYTDMEEFMLAEDLQQMHDELGGSQQFVKAALKGAEAPEVASRLVNGTKLADPQFRKSLIDGGLDAVKKSTDPMIQWFLEIEPLYRSLRNWHEQRIDIVESLEGAAIAQAKFAAYGKTTYPDATFSLRLSYGSVAGLELGTTLVAPKTNFFGLYGRSASFDNKAPFELSPLLAANESKVKMATPLNFVSTNDIVGGNSGSPVLNRQGQYVGLIFDGNIQSLGGTYAYSEEISRAVSVHSSAILEALRSVYDMPKLIDEITGVLPVMTHLMPPIKTNASGVPVNKKIKQ